MSLAGIRLDRASSVALPQQIAAQMRDGILHGTLPAGTQFLGSREIARELGCSRMVVLSAWDILYAEGYLESMPRGGVSVAAVSRNAASPAGASADTSRIAGPISQRWQSLIGFTYETNWASDFSPGAPDISTFPFGDWARLLRQTSLHPDKEVCLDLSPAGLPELRREIADFLGAVRGLVCTPEQIVVTSGTSSALDLCSRMILDHGDEVWVEEPGFVEAQWSLTAAGGKLVPIPVDDKGLCVTEGIRRAPNAKLIVVTPSHQYPLGVSMGLERRLELLDWANRNDVWIVEDDYNSEFRHQDSMIASLKSLDREQRVIYLGTFSKIMMPSLRLGYIVAPERFVEIFTKGRARIDVHSSGIGQRALAEFMREGHLLRHLRRMRKVYAERQKALMDAIRQYLPDDLTVAPCATGLHLVALFTERLKARMSDVEAARLLKQAGLHVQPLSQNHLETPIYAGLVLGYGSLKPTDATRLIAKMAQILGVKPSAAKK
ncbi:GntR family transcriptional regulator / MocR family aminotransferase [Tardiphaga sp. OK246]|jgi:GntR family transcriptional regulator/MocR family aminotransferase|uniref:MocR-like pyridoxine biosynthesis transcription factor PdxR n=1 Tax=Tardiphaga sp. OK246 TaxID=1855307 RepID=UPI000B6BBDCE|nr:PLP-dependent aminotransferase family protein [Tardiphaga sp. OK246]SNT52315.1 GntR family transcriptional regulator / MocR family aminotransferase [Tardiphaga sp. OK246]